MNGTPDYNSEVNNLYHNILGRQADPTGLAGFVNILKNNGNNLSEVQSDLYNTPEFKQDTLDPSTLVNRFANGFAANLNPNLTPFDQIVPFSKFFNAPAVQQQAIGQYHPYYQDLLNNFNQKQQIESQNYQNTYNTQKNYLTASQQAYLNYHNAANAYNMAKLSGQYQGQGMGSSSQAQSGTQNQALSNAYDINSQTLGNQQQLAQNQNTFDYNTGLLGNEAQSFNLSNTNAEKTDEANYYNTQSDQAHQLYGTAAQNYYGNQNYFNNFNNGSSGTRLNSNAPTS